MKVNLTVSRRGGGIAFLKAPWRQSSQFGALRTWGQVEEIPLDEKKGCRTSSRSAKVSHPPEDVLSGAAKRAQGKAWHDGNLPHRQESLHHLPLKRSISLGVFPTALSPQARYQSLSVQLDVLLNVSFLEGPS